MHDRDSLGNLTTEERERADALHEGSIIVDALSGEFWPEPPNIGGEHYVHRLVSSGITAATVTVACHAVDLDALLKNIYSYTNLMDAFPNHLTLVETTEDIKQAKADKKTGVIFGLQTGTPVGNRIELWTILHKIGVRQVQLTYNEANVLGHGCYEPGNGGLTWFGIQAVNECNRLGILLDCSHAGERTSLDIMDRSTKPVIFSHSNAKSLMPYSPRCLTDEQIKLCAASGGVIGLSPHTFMSAKDPANVVDFEDYLDHFEYIAALVGADHVGLGTDVYETHTKVQWESGTKRMYPGPYTFETMYPPEFRRITDVINVTRGLVARGFTDEDVRKILGLNLMRVFSEVW